MTGAVGNITLTIRVAKKPWLKPATAALIVACDVVALVSNRLAGILAYDGCEFLAKHGFKCVATETENEE